MGNRQSGSCGPQLAGERESASCSTSRLDHLVDYGSNGTWLRVPLGKLNNERSVPVDDTALEPLHDWLAHRPSHRAGPHADHRLGDLIAERFPRAEARMSQEQVHGWWRAAVDDLGEELPHPDAIEALQMAFVDRVLAHAQATGLLERVTCRTDGPVLLRGDEGEEQVLAPGKPLVLVDRGGRAYRLVVEG